MAIKIKNLEQIASDYTTKSYVYKDISFDIQQTRIKTPGYRLPVPGSDIKADFDLGAIVNSMANLFNTLPGQRFLFPEYGLNLHQFLFEPISKFTGELIGQKIFDCIKKYEPRVRPILVDVKCEPDENLYYISIIIEIPLLSQSTQTQFVLDIKKQAFISLPTSRNI